MGRVSRNGTGLWGNPPEVVTPRMGRVSRNEKKYAV